MKPFVLDSFALLALFRAEPGGPRVQNLLIEAERGQASLTMASVNLGEVFYKTVREHNLDRAQEVLAAIKQMPIEVLPVDENLALAAAEIKSAFRISYAYCIAAALAQRQNAPLVTGDKGFGQIPDLQVEWLPE